MSNDRSKLWIWTDEGQWSFQDKWFSWDISWVALSILMFCNYGKSIWDVAFFFLNYLPGWWQANYYRFGFFLWKPWCFSRQLLNTLWGQHKMFIIILRIKKEQNKLELKYTMKYYTITWHYSFKSLQWHYLDYVSSCVIKESGSNTS